VVVMVGKTRRHEPVSLEVGKHTKYAVMKVNSSGVYQRRYLVILQDKGLMLNFNQSMQLRRRVPLSHLTVVERPRKDPLRVALVFTSEGLQGGDRDMETRYNLTFTSARRCEEFAEKLLLAQSHASPASGDTAAAVAAREVAHGDAAATAPLFREILTKLRDTDARLAAIEAAATSGRAPAGGL
jgi:hypothetical protein